MQINIGPLLRGETDKIPVSFEMEAEPIEDVAFTGKVMVNGEVCGNAGYTRLYLTISVPYKGECARCLDEVCGVFTTDLERTCVTKNGVSKEELEENEDEYIIISESSIDPEDAVNATVFFEFPQRLLCSEDCPGLCPNCGKKLTAGENCACKKKELDPRLAKLAALFDDE